MPLPPEAPNISPEGAIVPPPDPYPEGANSSPEGAKTRNPIWTRDKDNRLKQLSSIGSYMPIINVVSYHVVSCIESHHTFVLQPASVLLVLLALSLLRQLICHGRSVMTTTSKGI